MASLVDALTEQLQLWLGESVSITPRDLTDMLETVQTDALQTQSAVTIRVEGEASDVATVVRAIKVILQVTEHRANTAMLNDGRIRRELNMTGQEEVEPPALTLPGNLDPQRLEPEKQEPAQPERPASERLLFEALQTLARGLLKFPQADNGLRNFGGAYPATFKDGISKLNAYFLGKGIVFDDSMEYWRLLSKPLKDWPHMPAYLQSPDPFIDADGRTTVLAEHLAKMGD